MKLTPSAVETQSLNHWITRTVPGIPFQFCLIPFNDHVVFHNVYGYLTTFMLIHFNLYLLIFHYYSSAEKPLCKFLCITCDCIH